MGNAIATGLSALSGPPLAVLVPGPPMASHRVLHMPTRNSPAGPLWPRSPAERVVVHEFGGLSAFSASMAEVMRGARRLARTSVTITITGETGTGKDVFAHAIHAESSRSAGAFVVFDCGAVPPTLIESELFGHERGAFTGAVSKHAGAFERARGGTLFLDEVGELPLDLQPKLLRALESRCIKRVGGTGETATDVRVIAATNRDLSSEVAEKRFREDLYFRLAAAVVSLPPLRARLDDLPLLVQQLLTALGHAEARVSPSTLTALRGHLWPGNRPGAGLGVRRRRCDRSRARAAGAVTRSARRLVAFAPGRAAPGHHRAPGDCADSRADRRQQGASGRSPGDRRLDPLRKIEEVRDLGGSV